MTNRVFSKKKKRKGERWALVAMPVILASPKTKEDALMELIFDRKTYTYTYTYTYVCLYMFLALGRDTCRRKMKQDNRTQSGAIFRSFNTAFA
jgi:hypothetical protein